MECVKALSPDRHRRSLIIDDIPVPSPKKDFNALLEERLQDVNGVIDQIQKSTRKFPFLKKGQGLARYKPNPENARTRTRARSLTLPSNTKLSPVQKTVQKSKEIAKPFRRSEDIKKLNVPPSKVILSKPITTNNNTINNKSKNASNKVRSTSIGGVTQIQLQQTKEQQNVSSDLNSSDPEIKTIKELEEVRIFELMEEKAENSSFCSNSSAVVAFLQQSSPLRNQLFMQRLSSQSRKASNDHIQVQNQQVREVVCTTSNFLACRTESPLRRARQQLTAINDEDSAKWENFEIHRKEDEEKDPKITNSQEKIVCTVPYGLDVVSDDEYSKTSGNRNEDLDESNASLHVRFAEFNEYKTIGLSDVSSISTDSRTGDNYSDNRAWSECSMSPDSSDVEGKMELLFINGNFNGSAMRKNLVKQFYEQKVDVAENDIDSYDDESTTTKTTEEEEEGEIDDEDCSSKTSSHDDTLLENNENNFQNRVNKVEQVDDHILFKSELLKSRLYELEREIEVFRNENNALKIKSQKVDEERKELQKLMKKHEDMARAEKMRMENYLMEEKKRLAREKAALDSRLKDAREKAQKNKQERDEIASLRQKLDELREELYQKESKWQAAQARHKSQVRVLTTQNKELKDEIERFEKLKLERQKPRKPKAIAKANTRAIHQINRMLQTTARPRNKSCSSEEESLENYEPSPEPQVKHSPNQQQQQPSPFNIERQRHLYNNLLKDASIGIAEYEEAKRIAEEQCKHAMKESSSMEEGTTSNQDNIKNKERILETRFALNLSKNAETSAKIQKSILKNVKEIQEVDGHIEHLYSNGNVMKIFPDKNLKKLIYYNGDVRESDATGKIKYFYASSRTWHTTMPDGLEILEYPDGKVEKRTKDGKTEISYPDGSTRIWEANGLEKWTLPDGTVGETLADGSKVFKFTNGQREVHTKDHKRREYPDGTLKIVYTDGTHETRYNNGRVRLKDKDGNLVMDSHQ